MIYNNLIYLIVVIFILSTNSVPDVPQLGLFTAALIFALKVVIFRIIVSFLYRKKRITQASDYFSAELKLSILAITWVAVDVYFLDCQYYFSKMLFADKIPSLVSLGGVVLYFLYLSFIWLEARKSYAVIFGRTYSKRTFIETNLKNNIPIILPWLLLSFVSDGLLLLPFPQIQTFMTSSWGEPVFFISFFLLLAISFPEVITRFWNCYPMQSGLVRRHMEAFCQQQGLKYRNIMIWPLFEGQVLTAGIMGLVKRFRYLLITPALLKSLTAAEVDAVLAHEIGHVKRYHLQLYIFLLLGFSLIAQLGSYLFMYLLLKSELFYEISAMLGKQTDTVLIFSSTLALLLLLIFYFRVIFGFFMRNFERQADLHAFTVMGSSAPIINALEKVAWLSGDIRDLPSWHHFGIAERVEFLEGCDKNPRKIYRHHRKVYSALFLFILCLFGISFTLWKMPNDLLERAPLDHLAKLYQEKTVEEPGNSLWFQLLGDLQQGRYHYQEAVAAYEQAHRLSPDHPEILNNLAWVLLTAKDKTVLDPERALMLARAAAEYKPTAYILDTLATAYWMNGFVENAKYVEQKAMAADPENKEFYMQQMEKFATPPPLLESD